MMNETITVVKAFFKQLFHDVKSSVCNHSRVLTQTHMQLIHSWVHSLGRWPCSEEIAERKLSLFCLLPPNSICCALNVVSGATVTGVRCFHI